MTNETDDKIRQEIEEIRGVFKDQALKRGTCHLLLETALELTSDLRANDRQLRARLRHLRDALWPSVAAPEAQLTNPNLTHKRKDITMIEGFFISLVLHHENISGLAAVDRCRQLQLPKETAHLYTNQDQVSLEVSDESNIRTWFGHSSFSQSAVVKLDWLMPSEVRVEGNNRIFLNRSITEERIWVLYIRATVEKLHNEIGKLRNEIDQTRAELAEAQNDLAHEKLERAGYERTE